MKKITILSLAIAAVLVSCNKDDHYPNVPPPAPEIKADIVKAAGDSAAIIASVNQFRSMLGDSLNTAPGKTGGRREVNWDGVPPTFTNNNNFPLDFFNATDPNLPNGRKRGLVYLNNGSPIRIDSTSFSEIESSYADQLLPFSKKRAVISASSVVSEIVFKVAGTDTDAFVKGFGIIFTDVDDASSTYLEFFNGSKSLGVFYAPQRNATGGFSFLGVHFPDEKVTRIKITAGNAVAAPGVKDLSSGGSKDVVAYDDFFYSEPKANQ